MHRLAQLHGQPDELRPAGHAEERGQVVAEFRDGKVLKLLLKRFPKNKLAASA